MQTKKTSLKSEFEKMFEIEDNIAISQKQAKTIDEFSKLVRVLTDHWDVGMAWFRGHSKGSYELIPSLYRETVWDYNEDDACSIEDEFIRYARSFHATSAREMTRWEWYQIMQHHGLPTRLLDWSSASNVGLFFAIRDMISVENPCVWVLQPFALNEINTGKSSLFYTDPKIQREVDCITDSYILRANMVLPEFPVAILPAHIVPRITAQHGAFTVHGRGKNSLEVFANEASVQYLAKIRISEDAIERLRFDLGITGIIETTLFPDLDGLARHLKWEYGLK